MGVQVRQIDKEGLHDLACVHGYLMQITARIELCSRPEPTYRPGLLMFSLFVWALNQQLFGRNPIHSVPHRCSLPTPGRDVVVIESRGRW